MRSHNDAARLGPGRPSDDGTGEAPAFEKALSGSRSGRAPPLPPEPSEAADRPADPRRSIPSARVRLLPLPKFVVAKPSAAGPAPQLGAVDLGEDFRRQLVSALAELAEAHGPAGDPEQAAVRDGARWAIDVLGDLEAASAVPDARDPAGPDVAEPEPPAAAVAWRRETANVLKEFGVELAVHLGAFAVGHYASEPITKLLAARSNALRATLTTTISAASLALSTLTLLYTRMSREKTVVPNMISDSGRLCMTMCSATMLTIALTTHSASDAAASDVRAVITVLAKTLLTRTVDVDHHRPDKNNDGVLILSVRSAIYFTTWLLVIGGSGVMSAGGSNYYRTGSSSGVVDASFGQNFGPMTTYTLAAALADAVDGVVKVALRQWADKRSAPSEGEPTPILRADVGFHNPLRALSSAPVAALDEATILLSAYLTAFNSIGLVSRISASSPEGLATGFRESAAFAFIFAALLPGLVAANTHNPATGLYGEASPFARKWRGSDPDPAGPPSGEGAP